MSALQTYVAVSSTQNEDGELVDAVPSVSVEEAPVRAVETAEPWCQLARSAKLDVLFKVLTSFPFSCTLLGDLGSSSGDCCSCQSRYSL